MNAIILAAGLGSRFGDITKKNHKALLPVGSMPNIERTINSLKEFGIIEIHIVTGHMHHLFEYLKEKHACNLIYNEKYAQYNSIYSLYCAQEFFNDTLVIDADVVLLENIFQQSLYSCYYIIQRSRSEENEWVPCLNEEGFVENIVVTNKYLPSLLGVSYWVQTDCQLIKKNCGNI
ncbi:NTP transferase domain-containing protein [Candidatus Fukatsuia endosymbiont of Tuberolachnus salignus]|uniref:NTP transferase domain-containing protein n=1 Tax=Candidatus Fukatsuia endosymbiont of Tuberolachnus salignus TaxID=3077957 RepID=UPI00313ADC33